MSCFNADGTGLNEQAEELEKKLGNEKLDDAISGAFQNGMSIDEIMYVTMMHTQSVLKRSLVQWQLKNAANKDRTN